MLTKNFTPSEVDPEWIGHIISSKADSSQVEGTNCAVRIDTVLFEWTCTRLTMRIYVHAIGKIVVESDENTRDPFFVCLNAEKMNWKNYKHCISYIQSES